MTKIESKTAQAAIELAVFGAILVFVLGTIVRSALGNAYTQNEGFKAMRMAMLASWEGTQNPQGQGVEANTSRNSASILIVEDRLSPDFNKYGPMDRNPYVNQGSGTFSYNLYYPWQPGQDNPSQLIPIMDVWINGQHFPLSTSAYVVNRTIPRAVCPSGLGPYETYPLTQAECLQNQCLRNAREWAGGTVSASQFDTVIPDLPLNNTTVTSYGQAIFHALIIAGAVGITSGTDNTATTGFVPSAFSTMPTPFYITDPITNQQRALTQQEINTIQTILLGDKNQYKLFYTREVNGTPQFLLSAASNMFDLERNNDPTTFVPVGMRPYIAWQWDTKPATTASSIGLDLSSNKYPTFDIDGRLKEVTVYGISQNPDGSPSVTYEDSQGGDIDSTWDQNSCGPKPGLQSDTQLYTFTMAGTYLEIREGQLYDPETDQFVRSANKRDTIDVIQRSIQLSNNTEDFCNGAVPQGSVNGSTDPNPVEVCIAQGVGDNCFTAANIAKTCLDGNSNIIFVRSRLLDQRGRYWMTDTSGQLQVQ